VWEFARAKRPAGRDNIGEPTVYDLAGMFLGFGAIATGQEAKRFYQLFYAVRTLFSDLIVWRQESLEEPREKPGLGGLLSEYVPVFHSAGQHAFIGKNGRISIVDEPVWSLFKGAINGIEVSRIRRCPVCNRVYYATRANKGACDDHLALAAVWRARGKAPTYQSGRQFRHQAGLKGVRGRKRTEIVKLHAALTRHGKEENDE
jgi:hypothetical protein